MLHLKFKGDKKTSSYFFLALIQVLIVIIFISLLKESSPINPSKLKKTDVYVEKTSYMRYFSEYRFNIFSQSTRYSFANLGAFSKYSNNELHKNISVGDYISITYYEKQSFFGKSNMVVDARTEEQTYRTLKEYNENVKGLWVVIVILFVVIELVYIGGCLICFWLK